MSDTLFSRAPRRITVLRVAVMLTLAATFFAVPRFTASASGPRASGPFTIGVSNGLVGNGWREEMKCSVKAEARADNPANKVIVNESNLDAAKQVAGIRDLISAGANAIIIDPPDDHSADGAIQQAVSRHIVVVVVDQFVKSTLPYQAANDQYKYGYRGMLWLAKRLNGHGNVVILRGIAGAPADTAREQGIQAVLKMYPGIHVLKEVYTNWTYATGGSEMLTLLRAYKNIDGVWTSGIDYTAVQAFQTLHRKFVPIVGADNEGFVHQLVTMKSQGLVGAAVTNPPPIGGVGAAIALKVLKGGTASKITKLTPKVWDNVKNLATLRAHDIRGVPVTYAVDWRVLPYTHYTLASLLACK
ncbi:MAG: substrate-binding domain-containing protein [Chloroflexi bacterium]|nr:substrate-binding domain-containing protein [Chloroflexota bacterium]